MAEVEDLVGQEPPPQAQLAIAEQQLHYTVRINALVAVVVLTLITEVQTTEAGSGTTGPLVDQEPRPEESQLNAPNDRWTIYTVRMSPLAAVVVLTMNIEVDNISSVDVDDSMSSSDDDDAVPSGSSAGDQRQPEASQVHSELALHH